MFSTPYVTAFHNAAGTVSAHPAGYAVLRIHRGPWPTTALTTLFTHAGHLLLQQQWRHLLLDARHLPPLGTEARHWLQQQWQGRQVPRPPQLHVVLLAPNHAVARLALAELRSQERDYTHYYQLATEAEAHDMLARLVR